MAKFAAFAVDMHGAGPLWFNRDRKGIGRAGSPAVPWAASSHRGLVQRPSARRAAREEI